MTARLKKYILTISAIFITLCGFAQQDLLVRFYPVKIGFETKMIIPIDQEKYLYEYYSRFKGVYFLNSRDTLQRASDSTYQSSSTGMTFNNLGYLSGKSICDSLINVIRNSSLNFRTSSILDDSARSKIGYNNQAYRSLKYEEQPTEKQQYEQCHNQYIDLNNQWLNSGLKLIDGIEVEKQKRLLEITGSDELDFKFIQDFIATFNRCEPDQRALIILLTKQPQTTLQALETLSETEFYSIRLKLSDLPPNLGTTNAIEQLELMENRSKYNRKLTRTLKKYES